MTSQPMNSVFPPPPPAGVRPVDRLGFTLFIAAIVHLILLLGVSFSLPEQSVSKTLEVTLAQFKSEEKPKQADFLAQENQQGSGSEEQKLKPTTTQNSPFQASEQQPVASQVPAAPRQATPPPKPQVTTKAPREDRVAPREPARTPPAPAPETSRPRFDRNQLSADIASLEAELADAQQRYAKRPRIHRLSASSTMRDKGAWYKEEWRKKIERFGNLNYPQEARRQGIYGSLRLLVSINSDGSLHEVQVLQSSGHELLDSAARRIVQLAAPYAPFSGDLSDIDRLEIIRTWRFERGDRLSSQ